MNFFLTLTYVIADSQDVLVDTHCVNADAMKVRADAFYVNADDFGFCAPNSFRAYGCDNIFHYSNRAPNSVRACCCFQYLSHHQEHLGR